MGRKTYELFPDLLPKGRYIVVSSVNIPGIEIARTVREALKMCTSNTDIFIVGEQDCLFVYKDECVGLPFFEYDAHPLLSDNKLCIFKITSRRV